MKKHTNTYLFTPSALRNPLISAVPTSPTILLLGLTNILFLLYIIIQTSISISNRMSHRCYFNGRRSLSWNQNSNGSAATNYRYMRSCTFRILPGGSEFSPVDFLKHLADRVARAIRLFSARRRHLPGDSSSLGRSKPVGGASVDSYRTDAVEDCIEFIHSSFSRSNSSSTTCHHQDSLHAF